MVVRARELSSWLRSQAPRALQWSRESVSAPLMLMYFLLLVMNTLLRDTKDTLLVTSAAGVEAIPLLKAWVVIPFSMAYLVLYYKLSQILNARQLFYCILLLFNCFFIAFALVFYPWAYGSSRAAAAGGAVGAGGEGALRNLLDNWLLGLFYCVAELYASAVCQFLFWQVANDVTSFEEAKAIYPLVGAMGNLGMVCAGYLLRVFANQRDVIAANAYLSITSSRTTQSHGGAGAGSNDSAGAASAGAAAAAPRTPAPLQPLANEVDVSLAGASVFSEYLVPLMASRMNPVDTAWQATLFGISMLLLLSTGVIVLSYEAVYRRKERARDGYGALGLARSHPPGLGEGEGEGGEHAADLELAPTGLSKVRTNSNELAQGTMWKRRTGSGNALSAAAAGVTAAVDGSPSAGGAGLSAAAMQLQQLHDANGTDEPSARNGSPRGPAAARQLHSGKYWDLLSDATGASAEAASPPHAPLAFVREHTAAESGSPQGGAGEPSVSAAERKRARKDRPKLGLLEGLRLLSQSAPLRSAAILVISYGVTISLVEVSWKGQVKKAFASSNDYSRFMAGFWTSTGLVSMAFMLLGKAVLQSVGYGPAVLFTPSTMAIAGTLFFAVSVMQDLTEVDPSNPTAVPWAAYFGGAAVLFAKAAKYAFFDATKEIIFIPLDAESKSLGKAAIDVVAYRVSKSGGSFVLQAVVLFVGPIASAQGILPIAMVFGIVTALWIHAAISAAIFIARNSPDTNLTTDTSSLV
jgi:ATP/ADP translocase